jgi:DNA mismatch repair protein MutS
VKVHETEKSGVSLQITSRRSQNLKAILEKHEGDIIEIRPDILIPKKDIRYTKSSASNVEIEFPLLDEVCRKLLVSKGVIQSIIVEVYLEILTTMENLFLKDLEYLACFVSKLDVLQCKTYIAKNYNYCRPTIDDDAPKSFVDTRELRHCLIEHIQQNEIYVTNDLSLGMNECDGILLYGTNAVGKTSLIRALGISVIMAQSGLYVPCSTFVYKPYTAIFSRILGNDNLFKGLSTFAVEMSELRIILKMADENSLILGDELCSGTEMESALSIFVSGLMKMHQQGASFIFATHFHEITTYDEIRELNNLKMKHMAIHYDRERDCLVYDRKLREGSGPRIYGLEVCKSLYLDDNFLTTAFSIRNKYYPETNGELSFAPATVYNSKKIKGMCEMCGNNVGEEIHHLQQQKEANEDGFIGSFHKNHVANLLTVCEECHNKIHSNTKDIGKIRKKTTKGYQLMQP